MLPVLVLSLLGPLCFCGSFGPRRAPRVESLIRRNAELRPVILCPAQFGTAEDYEDLKSDLKSRGFALYPAPLSRLDWLRIVPSTFTKEFFTAELRPNKTLGFFYEALDKALARVEADFTPDVPIAVLGHSIGGWVARSYIGEVLAQDARLKRIRSLVTLGTPHNAPPEDSWLAAVDQTRGLLSFINKEFPSGFPLQSSAVTCVAGTGTRAPSSIQGLLDGLGDKVWDEKMSRSKLLEQLVALASYLPLSGEALGVEGDGLIPVGTAVMPGCASVVLEDCNHADFVPTPGKSLKLPDTYKWYGSPEFIDQWAKFL